MALETGGELGVLAELLIRNELSILPFAVLPLTRRPSAPYRLNMTDDLADQRPRGGESAAPIIVANGRASLRSLRGLDWFAFFVADIQTGWGPFVAAYLTSVAWTQFDIGLVLTIGTLAAFTLQIPAGALVDQVPAKRLLLALAVAAISGSALLLALSPTFGVVVGAKVLHALASCLLGPALAAVSLGLVGYTLLSVRLGRNARFLSLGNAIAAGGMGVFGYYLGGIKYQVQRLKKLVDAPCVSSVF
jgi:hypothetical protein